MGKMRNLIRLTALIDSQLQHDRACIAALDAPFSPDGRNIDKNAIQIQTTLATLDLVAAPYPSHDRSIVLHVESQKSLCCSDSEIEWAFSV